MPSRRSRSVTLVTVLVLAAFSILALSAGSASNPVTSALRAVGSTVLRPFVIVVDAGTRPVGNLFEGILNYGQMADENAKLRAVNAQLRTTQLEQTYEAGQLKALAKLDGLPFVSDIPTVIGQTIAQDSSNFAATITLNKGRNQGIQVGMPVVGSGGLVGQVVQTSRTTSVVRLITDGRSKVGAGLENSAITGIVSGQAAYKPLTLDFVAPQSGVGTGDVLYTNGLKGGEYPAGIPVAKVTSAASPTNATQMSITLMPMANLSKLTYVEVLLWNPPL